MAGFDWFDPYAIKFDKNCNQGAVVASSANPAKVGLHSYRADFLVNTTPTAKVANPANVYAVDPLETFAALASLATSQPPFLENQVEEPAWSDADWRAYFSERTSFVERVRGLPNLEARAVAFSSCVAEWLNRHPVASNKNRCLVCGHLDHNANPLTPFGTRSTGHAWLHIACWGLWRDEREQLARSELAKIGVCSPVKSTNNFGKI